MRGPACVLLALAVAACGARPQPIVLQPPAGPPPGIDGRYRGTARLIRAADRYCPRSGARVLEVSAGTVSLSYSAAARQRVSLTATVESDGRIQASDGVGTMEGQVGDGKLDVTIASRQCEHRWSLTRVE